MAKKDIIDYEIDGLLDLYEKWQNEGESFDDSDVMDRFLNHVLRNR